MNGKPASTLVHLGPGLDNGRGPCLVELRV